MSDQPSANAIRTAILELLGQRDPQKTICPSEVARLLEPDSWRGLMEPVRAVAAELAATREVEVTQRGDVVDVRTVTGPVRLRRGPAWPGADREPAHWLLPMNPEAHPEHLPADWRTRDDATAIWQAIGRSQNIERWCLSTGYRQMRIDDVIWAYLSRRQQICAVGRVAAIENEDGRWFVRVTWSAQKTARLCLDPLPRSRFKQIPMSTCRADEHTTQLLEEHLHQLGTDPGGESSPQFPEPL